MSALDTQVGGDHYKRFPLQPVEIAMTNKLNYCQANILKYVMRAEYKHGVEDLDKAMHYIELYKEFLTNDKSTD